VRNFAENQFFHLKISTGEPVLTVSPFPDDLNATSTGLTVIERDESLTSSIMDEMLDYVNKDGIMQVSPVSKLISCASYESFCSDLF
jgi:hypothetical protein